MRRDFVYGTMSTAIALAFVAVALFGLLFVVKPAHAKTFNVNYTGDATDGIPGNGSCNAGFGLCSLRAAIEEANAFAGADTIAFNIGGTGVKTIKPTSVLPTITERVTINGYSQPGAKANTLAKSTNAVLKSVGTNASGNVSFTFKPNKKVPIGHNVTATATDSGGNTSEFSAFEIVV